MLLNYFKVAIRNILKHKTFSVINVLGLAIGMSACLLIIYYVSFERSYDKFHENSDRIYRLRYERTDQEGQSVRFASCCPPAGLRIREKYPDVEKVARLFRQKASVSYQDKMFIEERMYYAENEFFEIFKYKFISGDPVNGIKEPNKAFISASTAEKYFGNKNPVGEILSVDKKVDYQITGVFEDIPANSHLKFDIVLSYPSLINYFGQDVENSWGDSGWFTYLLLKQNADPKTLEAKLPSLIDTEFIEALKYYKLTCELPLQPLNDIHLNSHFMQEYEVNGDYDTVNLLSIIAVFIIVIAWVNYINLSTARSLLRAKEISLRKVVGASRRQLITQLFFETILINFAAILLACLIILITLPFFRDITGTPVQYSIWVQSWFWQALLIMWIAGVFLSGLYPIIVLTSYQPATVLHGKFGGSIKGFSLRKILVAFQFIMALILLISTFTVFSQLVYMKNQDLGFTIDQKLILRAPRVRDETYTSKLQTFKQELLNNPAIGKFCSTTDVPGKQSWWDAGAIHRKGSDDNKNYQIVGIDEDFANVFDLKFASGRNFSKEIASDVDAIILNETAAKWLGFNSSEEAIGGEVVYWDKTFRVIGVLKDYHQQSLKHSFEPHIFRFMPEGRGVRGLFALKIESGNTADVLQAVRKQYDLFFPGNPFEYFFLDDYFNEQYQGDELFGKVFAIFSFFSTFVTSLGILGLSSFIVIQRKKEIAIRKVLGANVISIIKLITGEFQRLILIAFIIAVPISYFGIDFWLESFAAKMELHPGIFLIPLVILAVITVVTICIHVIKAAVANPVDSLKYE